MNDLIEGDVGRLAAGLRRYKDHCPDSGNTILDRAADTLLSQQQEIEALRRTNVTLHKDWVSLDGEYHDFAKEKQREIERLKKLCDMYKEYGA